LNNFLVYVKLEVSTLVHRFFNALFSNESQDKHSLGLTNTVRTVLRLQIGMRIPICQSIKPKVDMKK